jgi:predicted GH43/DUF377 family glycosyl hydrolase
MKRAQLYHLLLGSPFTSIAIMISGRIALFVFLVLVPAWLQADDMAATPPPISDQYAPWMLGPFVRPDTGGKPILESRFDSVFDDPILKKPVHWEAKNVFNPGAVVKDGKIYLIYRTQDNLDNPGFGATSRLGLASSDDGIHFTRRAAPIVYPDNDSEKDREWPGGDEDPRVVELEDGSYVLFYTQFNGKPPIYALTAWATSKDLVHWKKMGPLMALDDKGVPKITDRGDIMVCCVRHGRLVATKIDGKYWMYFGGGSLHLMTSPDLKTWTLVKGFSLDTRKNNFDSGIVEGGPGSAVLTERGIVVLYNGENETDPEFIKKIFTSGQALFDAKNPAHLLARSDKPFYQPVTPYERLGRGIVFIEGLVLFHNQWLLYYGASDTSIGMAIAKVKPGEVVSSP